MRMQVEFWRFWKVQGAVAASIGAPSVQLEAQKASMCRKGIAFVRKGAGGRGPNTALFCDKFTSRRYHKMPYGTGDHLVVHS